VLKKYPLLNLQDGQSAFADQGVEVDQTLRRLMYSQEIDKVSVRAVDNHEHPRRMREYGNDFARYRDFLINVMSRLPFGHRLKTGPENVGVMGTSMGGLAGLVSLQLALDSPEIFGKCACLSSLGLSPSLLDEAGFTEEGEPGVFAADRLRQHIANSPVLPVRIYLDAGLNEDRLHDWTRLTHDQLSRRGYGLDQLLQVSYPNAYHQQPFWRERCHVALQFLFD